MAVDDRILRIWNATSELLGAMFDLDAVEDRDVVSSAAEMAMRLSISCIVSVRVTLLDDHPEIMTLLDDHPESMPGCTLTKSTHDNGAPDA